MPNRFIALEPEQLAIATAAFKMAIAELSIQQLFTSAAILDKVTADYVLIGLTDGCTDSAALGAWCVEQVQAKLDPNSYGEQDDE
ncbi:MAG: hypothetical protein AB7J19_12000 [Beijerinckiaceae bacterium]